MRFLVRFFATYRPLWTPVLGVLFLTGGVGIGKLEVPVIPEGGSVLVMPSAVNRVVITETTAMEISAMDWPEVPGSTGLRLVIRKAFPNRWNARADIGFPGEIAMGDSCLLWFFARQTPGSSGAPAVGTVQVENADPGNYQKLLAHDFQVGDAWSMVLVPFSAMNAVSNHHGRISFHLGERAQEIDIAGINLVHYGKRLEVTDLPRPVVTYPGREPDALWRQQALERIEKNRKGDFVVKVLGTGKMPVEGAAVSVDLRRHKFGFGSAVTAYWLNRPGPDGAMYREIVDRYFSRVVLENDLKEKGWRLGRATPEDAQFRKKWTDDALRWLETRDIEVRGHCLTWGVFDETTTPLRDQPGKLLPRVLEHMDEEVPAIGHRVVEWDVINHPASWSPTNRIDTVVGHSFYPDIMRHARSLGNVPLWLNEDQVFRPGRQQEDFHVETKRLIDAGLAPDGLGIQGHFHSSFLPAPEEMLEISDRFAGLVPKLQITEFDILANGDEDLQADWFRDCLIMAFSHPAYTGFQTWGFWERTVVRKEAMPWKADWSERPLAKVWKNWIGNYWHTRADRVTERQGEIRFRGYEGLYSVTVATEEGRFTSQVSLDQAHPRVTISIP